MSDVEVVLAVVITHLTTGVGKVAAAPLEAIADDLKERVARRLRRTLDTARIKAGTEPVEVPDRLAFKVFNEAAFTDDDVTMEYLAGVLAASGPDDDTGAAVVALIGRLSALQLRLHYVIYRELRRGLLNRSVNLYEHDARRNVAVQIPANEVMAALPRATWDRVGSALAVLYREGLVGDEWGLMSTPTGKGTLKVEPTGAGAELFLWGHGAANITAHELFNSASALTFLAEVPETPGATVVLPIGEPAGR